MRTNRDLIQYLYALEYEFEVCAGRVDALRAYFGKDNTLMDAHDSESRHQEDR